MPTKTLWTPETVGVCQDQAGVCRFTRSPLPECYCRTITTENVYLMLQFCAAEYKSCPVYRQNDT